MASIHQNLRPMLEERERRVERLLCRLRLGVAVAGCAADAITALHAGSTATAAAMVGFGLGYAAIVGWLYLVLGRAPYRPWVKYVITALDFGVLGAATAEWSRSGHLPIPVGELVGSMIALLVVVNLLSGLRAGRAIVVFSTTCAVAATVAVARGGGLSALVTGYDVAVIILSGLLAGLMSKSTGELFVRFVRRSELTRFLPRQLVERVDQGELSLELGGTEGQVTVLMSDIRGFTTLSETRRPAEIVTQLNEYFTAMSEVIFSHGGSIDKYIGDAILAVFGIPQAGPDDASRAVAAAREMLLALTRLNAAWIARGMPELRIGIGLHTGVAVAGNIGAPQRMEFTVIGDTVNVASRIEDLTKKYGRPLLFSESTQAALGTAHAASLVDEAEIRGRQGTIRLYTAG